MSSLAAVQADGFYHPPDYDPDKHGSLNKYHGSHALRERASRISEGILVIRFEVPFHIWCSKCGEKIAKGERFNADKKAIGMYHTTKILQFSMRHHCGCIITIQTDPKNAEYVVVEGAKKKVEDYSSADAEVIELIDDTEKERMALDPLYRLEQGEASRKRARTAAEDVADLLDDANAKHGDAYSVNARLRNQLRVIRKEAKALDARRKALHLPEEIRLLPMTDDDGAAAALAFYHHDASGGTARSEQVSKRRAILDQPIFPPPERLRKQSTHAGARPPPPTAGPAQTVTSQERQVTDSLGGGIASHKSLNKRSRHSSDVHDHDDKDPRVAGVWQSVNDTQIMDVRGRQDIHPAPDAPVMPSLPGVLLKPADQPGAAKGGVIGTAIASETRKQGLKTAHVQAQATVASWRAAKSTAKSAVQGTASVHSGTSQSHNGPKGMRAPAAATLLKAQALAQRSRVKGGVGFQVPERQLQG